MKNIEYMCETVQEGLWNCFWDKEEKVFQNHYPKKDGELWCYWWHAHALDVLLDGYERSRDNKYLEKIKMEYDGILRNNENSFLHNWYDDMEWMALVQLRLFDATKENFYKEQALIIWEDIKTAWNNHMGGGLAWKKDQLDYKNTPANAPAAILAYRLYGRFGDVQDLEWGNKILDWNIENLTNKETGFVWDGMNRLGNGEIDYEWEFTYCQGVIVGALLERYRITKNRIYLENAVKTAKTAIHVIAGEDGIFPYEGKDDCGLFRGIYMRYVLDLAKECPEERGLKDMILKNANFVIEHGVNGDGLIGGEWSEPETKTVDLAQHLSGVMLLEMAWKLKGCN